MAENFFSQAWANPKFRTALSEMGQDLGYGLTQSPTFGGAFGVAAQRGAQLQPYRDQQQQLQAEQAQAEQSKNATLEWLKSKGYNDLAAGVEGGGLDMGTAWSEGIRRSQPQQADPFTLGAGQVRYDGNGNIIAQGPEAGPQTVINNMSGATDEFYNTLDKNLATQTTNLIDAGVNAQGNNARLTQLETLLGPNGAPQGMQGRMVQLAGQYGLPVQGLDDVQAAQAIINQMVPGQRPPGSGTMSDQDLALFKQSLPSIVNQPGGNQKILQTMKAINDYTIQQAQIAQAVANREITPAEGRKRQAAVPNPLANASTMPDASAPIAINPNTGQKVQWDGSTWVPVT